MKKLNAFLVSVFATAALNAAVIEQVIVRQQWPWSTDVKVEYKISAVTNPVDIAIQAFNGNMELPLPAEAIAGDRYGISDDGVGTLVIDPVKAFGTAKVALANFKVKLTVTDSLANIDEVVYKIFDLKTGECRNVTRADFFNNKMGAYERDFTKIGTGFNTSLKDVLIWTDVTNHREYVTTKLVMRRISGGGKTFMMGSPSGETGREPDGTDGRENQREVVLAGQDYFIGVFPLTIAQVTNYAAWVQNGSIRLESGANIDTLVNWPTDAGAADECPLLTCYPYAAMRGTSSVATVSDWPTGAHAVDDNSYLDVLRKKTLVMFDLPTEAQWEYACRGGTVTGLNNGLNLTSVEGGGGVGDLAWFVKNANSVLHRVGSKRPNAFGLYDMHGSVYECCLDYYVTDTSALPQTDVGGPASRPSGADIHTRVLKGGPYTMAACYVRSGWRRNWVAKPAITAVSGVRLVCPADGN